MGIRLTGLDTPIAGLSWEVAKDDAESAFKIIKYMEDKRVLYNPQHLEIPEYCIRSIRDIRSYLTEELQNNSKDMKINKDIEKMCSYCRSFLNNVENETLHFNFWSNTFTDWSDNNRSANENQKKPFY